MKPNFGVEGIKVTLLSGPERSEIVSLAKALVSSKGIKEVNNITNENAVKFILDELSTKGFAFTNFESLNFSFLIEGISRNCSHQLVRTRIGASYSQESARTEDVSDNDFIIPLTVSGCRNKFSKSDYYLKTNGDSFYLEFIELYEKCNDLYKRMLKAGVPRQDARYILPSALTNTSIVVNYTYPALYGVSKRRMCINAQWEIRAVALLMRKAILNWAGDKFKDDPEMKKLYYTGLAANLKPPCGKEITPFYNFNENYFELAKVCNNDENIFPACWRKHKLDRTPYSAEYNESFMDFFVLEQNDIEELISKIRIDDSARNVECYDCGKIMKFQERLEFSGEVKSEEFTITIPGFICECGYKTIVGKNQLGLFNRILSDEYRKKMNLCTVEEIEEFRERNDMTIGQLAAKINISEELLGHIMNGKIQDIEIDYLIKRIIRN